MGVEEIARASFPFQSPIYGMAAHQVAVLMNLPRLLYGLPKLSVPKQTKKLSRGRTFGALHAQSSVFTCAFTSD